MNAPPSLSCSETPAEKLSKKRRIPQTWGLAILLGMFCGTGIFTFGYGQGTSYFSNSPQNCANCHIMQDHLNGWQKSSHHHVAVCNDCHLPHDPLGKWITKLDNGFFHSLAFTLDDFHEPIQIKPRNRRVAEQACLHCHQDFVHETLEMHSAHDLLSCLHCHTGVGHASP